MKDWWKSKTLWINVLTLIIGVIGAVMGSEVVPPQAVAILGSIVLPILNVLLRWVTDQPISSPIEALDNLRPAIKQNMDARRYMQGKR